MIECIFIYNYKKQGIGEVLEYAGNAMEYRLYHKSIQADIDNYFRDLKYNTHNTPTGLLLLRVYLTSLEAAIVGPYSSVLMSPAELNIETEKFANIILDAYLDRNAANIGSALRNRIADSICITDTDEYKDFTDDLQNNFKKLRNWIN